MLYGYSIPVGENRDTFHTILAWTLSPITVRVKQLDDKATSNQLLPHLPYMSTDEQGVILQMPIFKTVQPNMSVPI